MSTNMRFNSDETQSVGLRGRSLAWGVGLGNRCTSIQSKGRTITFFEEGIRNIEKKLLAGSEKTK